MLFVSCRRRAGSALANTVRLGIQMFNPYRFNGVLRALSVEKSGVAPDELCEYWKAAERCFSNTSNIHLMPIDSIVDILAVLKRDFPESTVLAVLRHSLVTSIDKPSKLVDLVHSLERRSRTFTDATLVEEGIVAKLDLVPENDRRRISLSKYSPNPSEYLRNFMSINDSTIVSRLTEEEILVLLAAGGSEPILTCVLEDHLRNRLESARDLMGRVRVLDQLLTLGTLGSSSVVRTIIESMDDVFDVVSPSQAVDLISIFPFSSTVGSKLWENLKWRLDRDPRYLLTLDAGRISKLLQSVRHRPELRSKIVARLGVPMQRVAGSSSDLLTIANSFGGLPGKPWIEEREFADLLFRLITRSLRPSDPNMKALLLCIFEGLGVNDGNLVTKLLERMELSESEIATEISRHITFSAQQESRIGNLVLSSLMNRDCNDYEKILTSLNASEGIPIHARLHDLSLGQLVEILEVVPDKKLSELEMIADAASLLQDESPENLLEVLKLLSNRGMPCQPIADTVASRFEDLAFKDKVEFLSCCERSRVVPHERTMLKALASDCYSFDGSGALWASSIRSLSELGLLVDDKHTSQILDYCLASQSLESKSDRASLSASILASLFLSLKVPSDRQLTRLLTNIKECREAVDESDLEVLCEMNELIHNDTLSELVDWVDLMKTPEDQWSLSLEHDGISQRSVRVGRTNVSVADRLNGSEAVVVARPEDMYNDGSLTQRFKFKLFLIQQHAGNMEIRNWTSLN